MTASANLVSRNPTALIAAGFSLTLLVSLVASWPALTGPFLFDDFPNLRHLALLDGKLDWQSLANYMAQYEGEPGRPLSMLSFVVNDFAWPSAPWGFKYTNLMLHLLVGVFIFGFARSLTRGLEASRREDLVALLAMAAWLLHPMQLSTSMLVVQRMTQLSALFALAGLWGYVCFARRATTSVRAVLAIVALGFGTLLAVLCKETGALAPLLAVVANATVLNTRINKLPALNRILLRWGALLPVLLLLALLGWRWKALTGYGNRDFSMGERLLTQSRVLLDYLQQVLLPSLRGGGIYHDDFVLSRGFFQPWSTFPAVVFCFVLVMGAFACRRRWPMFAFAILWFFGAHLLESSVFPLEIYFEHRNYLPMFGPLFALSYWVVNAPERFRRPLMAMALAWIAFAGWLTWVQAPIWGDARKLTAVWAIEHPQSARATQQRAEFLSHRYPELAAETMLDAYRRGVRGADFPVQALNIACAVGNTGLARRTWPLVTDSLKDGAFDRALLATMGKLRRAAQRGTCPDILTADVWLEMTQTLLVNPNYEKPGARKYLYVERAYLFQHRRDLNGTMREFEAAWAARPSPDLAQLIAATLASAGLYDDAALWADRAVAHKVRGIRGWLSQDEVQSRRLRDSLQSARK